MGNLLLDVDGVLIRDRLITCHVEHNITQYIRAKLPDAKNPDMVRDILYKKYGHTGRGLARSFGLDTSDFNEKVYNKSLMTHLAEYLEGRQFQDDAQGIHKLIQYDGWKVTLFSNAPECWTRPIGLAIDSRIRIAEDDIFVKPEAGAYAKFGKKKDYIFVDDSIQNLLTPSLWPNWTCLHFADQAEQTKFLTCSSIWELTLMANTLHDLKT
jgi:hypothetical protein